MVVNQKLLLLEIQIVQSHVLIMKVNVRPEINRYKNSKLRDLKLIAMYGISIIVRD